MALSHASGAADAGQGRPGQGRRFLLWRLAPLLACGLLASCASLIGPRQVELPLARLQQGLEQRFPLNNRMLEVFDITLSRPQLTLQPDSERIALALEANVAPPFVRQSWSGHLELSGRLLLDPARNAVLIGDARIEQVALDGVDPARQRLLVKVANLAVEQLMRELPVYRFRPEELRFAGVQFVPASIRSTPQALLVTFVPAR